MAVFFRWIGLVIGQLLSVVAVAQLTVTSPVPRMVFQRNSANEAIVSVAGMAPSTATTVEARFVPLAIGQGAVTAWTPMSLQAGSSAFRGQITVSAGWYRLDVRAKAGATQLAQTTVNRVGVGEVFVVAGQSNAYGGLERVPSAIDDRVMCVDFRQDSLSEQLLPLQFSHVSYGTSIGPGQPPHIYGLLGDKIVQRLNVPVLFIGAALGGTSSTDWRQSAAGNIGTTPNPAVYRRMGAVLLHYISRTGARAVLWHQGESDLFSTTQTYFDNIKYVIEKSRQQVGGKPLAWVISRASYMGGLTSWQVITAQNQLISSIPNVFAGPATDNITGYDNRADDIHFRGQGLFRFVDAWDQSLTADFFTRSVPFLPTDSATLITSGYALPLIRRPGATIAVASVRSDPHESDNKYVAQVVRASDGVVVVESAPTTDNPIMLTLPFTMPNGQYRLRTRSTHPVLVGTPGEVFRVQQDAPPASFPIYRPIVVGGTADPVIRRFGYRFEQGATTLWGLVQATAPVEVKLVNLDRTGFADSTWRVVAPSSQAPNYDLFADFNYIQSYPARIAGVEGVMPGKYRFSIRRQGDTGAGLWVETTLLDGRNILYYPMEPVTGVPAVLTINNFNPSTCLSGSFNVAVDVSDSVMNSNNVFSVRLSDANGSFDKETTIGTRTTSPITATLAQSLPAGSNYRIRVVGSNPAVASAPSQTLSICAGGADLSMSMSVSSRTPDLQKPVTFTVVLANAGPSEANNVQVKSLLPTGLSYIDGTTGVVSASENTITINAGTIPIGTRRPFVFRVKPSQAGAFSTAAQITACSQIDPDSQPNSGTGDGEDDSATADLRTSSASGPLVVSSNPNQAPLPPIRPNQPSTDPIRADLSLALVSSNLVASPTQTVSLTLVTTNAGSLSATNVNLQTVLPTGWQLTVTTGLMVSGQTVTIPVGSISVGASVARVLSIRASSSGTLRAQVLSVTQPDPDSTPGNGYTKGEDDEASLILRVR